MGDFRNEFCRTNIVQPQHELKICIIENTAKVLKMYAAYTASCGKMQIPAKYSKGTLSSEHKGNKKTSVFNRREIVRFGVRRERSAMKCLHRLAVENVVLIFPAHRATKF